MNDQEPSNPAPGALLRQWWQALQPREAEDAQKKPADLQARYGPFAGALGRADRARLQRCGSPEAVLLQPAYAYLRHHWKGDAEALDVALVAGLVAQVRQAGIASRTRPFAALLGARRGGKDGPPVMSRLRFEQLLASTTPEDLFLRLRRAVELVGEQPIELGELAADLLQWCDELRGHVPAPDQRVRVRWAKAYFLEPLYRAADAAAPDRTHSPATAAP